jgi:tape measure domain-containing protein
MANEKLILEITAEIEDVKAKLQQLQSELSQLKETGIHIDTQNLRNAVALTESLKSAMRSVAQEVLAVGTAFISIEKAIQGIVDESQSLQLLTERLSLFSKTPKEDLKEIQKSARETGYDMQALLDVFLKLQLAGRDLKDLDVLAKTGRAFGLSAEELKLVGYAIEQIAGKGVLQLEELRQQLGERIPVAQQLMSKELGFANISQFYSAIEKGSISAKAALDALFSGLRQLDAAVPTDTIIVAFGNLKNAIQELIIAMGESGLWSEISSGIKSLADAIRNLDPNVISAFTDALKALFQVLGALAKIFPYVVTVIAGFIKSIQIIYTVIEAVIYTIQKFIEAILSIPKAISRLSLDPIKNVFKELLSGLKNTWERIKELTTSLTERSKNLEKTRQQTGKKLEIPITQFDQVDIDKIKRQFQAEDEALKARLQNIHSYVEALKSLAKDDIKLKLQLDLEAEERAFSETKTKLEKRKKELEKLLKLTLPGEQYNQLEKEYEKVQEEMTKIEQTHASRRLQILSEYVREGSRLLQRLIDEHRKQLEKLTEDYKKTLKSIEEDTKKLNNLKLGIDKEAMDQLNKLPPEVKQKLLDIISIDATPLKAFGSSLSELTQKYQQFMSALRTGANIETLKELRQGFLQAREEAINFVKSITPEFAKDVFSALGFREGFLPSRGAITQNLQVLFGMTEEEAKRASERFTQIWVDAQAKVAQAFRNIPGLSQFMTPEQLQGILLQRGLRMALLEEIQRQTQEINEAFKKSMQEAIQQLQSQVDELQKRLAAGVNIPVRLDLSNVEEQLKSIESRVLTIPAQLAVQNEGAYR